MLLGSVYPAVGSCLLIIVGITLLKISIIPVYSQLNISPGYKCEDVSFFLNRVRISIFLMSWATPQSSHVPPATAGEPPWSVSTPGWESLVYKYISEYRLRVRMCLLCLIYHLASALTMLLSGWVGGWVHCVCVCPPRTNRQAGAHGADCLAAKEVLRPVVLPRSPSLPPPTHPVELRRCPGTVSALVHTSSRQ